MKMLISPAMTCCQSLNGLIICKWLLIQILANRSKKCYFQETRKFKFIQGIVLEKKLIFKQCIDSGILKVKSISVIKKLRHSLPQKPLLTIFKAFLRPLIDYGDVIYGQPQNESFCEKLESVQCKATLAITGTIQGTSCLKIYQELGL